MILGLFLIAVGAFFIWARVGVSSSYPEWFGYTPRAIGLAGIGLIVVGLLIVTGLG